MTVRVYVPTTLSGLGEYDEAGVIPASDERVVAPDDDEESEYLALMSAADLSAELPGADRRRVVVVAEVAAPDGAIPMREVVAVHADPAPYADTDEELAWFATQEIADLLGGR